MKFYRRTETAKKKKEKEQIVSNDVPHATDKKQYYE